jgi:hypothetical protein
VLAAEHLPHLEIRDALVDGAGFLIALLERVGIALDGELEEDVGVVELGALALPAVERRRQLRAFALDLLRALVVVPEIRLADQLVERPQARFRAGDVKDAPEGSRGGARAPRVCPSARWWS